MDAQAENQAKEGRRALRTRTILGARAVFNDGHSVIDCQIRNLSSSGAMLALSEGLALPPVFELDVPMRNKKWRVALRWRAKGAVGVEFLDAQASETNAALDPSALALENAILRKRVGDLMRRLSDLGHSDWQK